MKKVLTSIIAVVLVLSCVLVVFAACEPPIDYEHTIVFYSSQGDALAQKTANAIAAFEAKYPGWTVLHQTQGGYDDVRSKVVSDFQGEQQPDIVYCYADHVAQYLKTSKVVDLNKFINSKETIVGKVATANTDEEGNVIMEDKEFNVGYTAEEIADFVEGYYIEGKAVNFTGYANYGYQSDSMLALPFVKSTEVLYYNATALKMAGLPLPTENFTWDELWAQCETLVKRFPNCTPLGYDSEANWFITMCEQNGWGYTSANEESHYLFNNQNTQNWLTQLAEYYQKGYISTQEEYGAYTSALFTAGAETGCIYCVGSSGGASHQNPGDAFEWGVVPVPGSKVGDKINNAAISQGPSLCILSGGHKVTNVEEKEKMAWLFLKEMLDPTFQAEFAEAAGYNPARESAYLDEQYAEFLQGNTIVAATANTASRMVDRYFTSPAFVGSSTARTQVGNALLAALTGQKDAAKALSDAYKNCGGK